MGRTDFPTESSTILESDITYHEQIGYGSECEVFRVTWKTTDGNIEAAAKKIKIPSDENEVQQLQLEIDIAVTFNHENLIKYYGHIITKSHVVIITEYAAKGSLYRYLKQLKKNEKRLSSAQVHRWASQAARGIHYLQSNGIVHRDIKSPNFLIMSDETLKLCDFGLSKYLQSTKTTNAGRGTFQWLAPEVWKDLKISPKADVFAFGIVLWELLTCEEPFVGLREEHVLYSVAYGSARPEIPARCPDVYRTLMIQCWEDDRNRRPTIDEIVEMLDGPQEIFGMPPGPTGTQTATSYDHVEVSWTPPTNTGDSDIIGYRVEYRRRHPENQWLKLEPDLSAQTVSYKLYGLNPRCAYQVRVAAVNSGGRGPYTETEVVTTKVPLLVRLRTVSVVTIFAVIIMCSLYFCASEEVLLRLSLKTASVVAIFAATLTYTISYLFSREDFQTKHSWSLRNQFGHEKSFGSAFLGGAQSLTINPTNGDILVADWYSTDVKIYNSSGHLIGNLDTSKGKQTINSPHPRDVAVSSNGTFFVSHQCPYVKVFDSSRHFVKDIESSYIAAENARLSGLAFTKDGRLVIGECRFNSINIHLQNGTRLNTFNIELTPRYLAITPKDTIVVSSWEPMAVQVMSLTGDVLHTLLPPSGITHWRPTGVCCSDDMIFIANDPSTTKDASIHDDHGVFCYSFSGKYLGIATKDVFNPTGVAVTQSGSRLVVAHWERGNTFEGRGLHGVKVFVKNELNETKT